MTEDEAYKVHVQYTFNAFCKIVIRHAAIDIILKLRRRWEREVSLDYLMNEKFVQLAELEQLEEFLFTACGQTAVLYHAELAASFENRNEYISRLCRYPLLILDDFGMECETKYGLEQVFNVIDSRYRSGKPLIVTTNLTLDDLHNPEDTAHSRIYDRLLSMCVPVRFTGDNFWQETAQRKMESMKKLITD